MFTATQSLTREGHSKSIGKKSGYSISHASSSMQVMFTVIQSLTRDGRDRGQDYKLSGFHVPPGCWDAAVRLQ